MAADKACPFTGPAGKRRTLLNIAGTYSSSSEGPAPELGPSLQRRRQLLPRRRTCTGGPLSAGAAAADGPCALHRAVHHHVQQHAAGPAILHPGGGVPATGLPAFGLIWNHPGMPHGNCATACGTAGADAFGLQALRRCRIQCAGSSRRWKPDSLQQLIRTPITAVEDLSVHVEQGKLASFTSAHM
jgi:hypothetical protein